MPNAQYAQTASTYEITERQPLYVGSNSEAHSPKYCCRVKAVNINILSVCLCSLTYPACKWHTPYYIVICRLSNSTTFFPYYLINGTIFGKKKLLKHKKSGLIQLLCQTFRILRTVQRDTGGAWGSVVVKALRY